MSLKWIVLVTDEDGSESAYGPWAGPTSEKKAEGMQTAFPHAHVRTLPLLKVEAMS